MKTKYLINRGIFPVLSLSLILFWGCGGSGDRPDLGEAEGNVTFDGKPLVGALIVFQPEKGRPSQAETDDNGHYVIHYKHNVPGAAVGKHQVSISTFREANPDAEDATQQKARKEEIPAKYNVKTTLTADVKPGANEPFNFDLTKGGEIVQPGRE